MEYVAFRGEVAKVELCSVFDLFEKAYKGARAGGILSSFSRIFS